MQTDEPDPRAGRPHRDALLFPSYATPDRIAAESLVNEIERAGISCWMAPRDIPFGSNWGTAIIEAIRSTEATVVLLSTHANESIHVANEIERAVSYRKPVVAVRVENVEPSRAIELHISARQRVDLFEGPKQREQNMIRLVNALRDMLRNWLVPELPPLGNHQTPASDEATALAKAALTPSVPGTRAPEISGGPQQGSLQRDHSVSLTENTGQKATDLPIVSDPAARKAVEAAIRDVAYQSGGYGGSIFDKNSHFVASSLYGQYGEHAVVELAIILSETQHDWETRWKAINLLKFCGCQPGARRYAPVTLAALCGALGAGGYVLDAALEAINQLPVPRHDKWSSLSGALLAAHAPNGHKLVDTLVALTPSDKRTETGAALVSIMHVANESLLRACMTGIQKLGFRAAAPDLREVLETTVRPPIAVLASEILANWRDREASTSIRAAMEQWSSTDIPTWGGLVKTLRTLEGPGCCPFVANLLSNADETLQEGLLQYGWLKAFHEEPVLKVIEDIAVTTANPSLRDKARSFLAQARGTPQ